MKYKLAFDLGWYKGNNFALFIIEIAEHYLDWWTLLHIQIIKFDFCIMLKSNK